MESVHPLQRLRAWSQVLCESIYSFLLVGYSSPLSAGVLHALLCLKVYSWCIHRERCIPHHLLVRHLFPFLLFNMLSRLVMTFLPRSKCLLISWLLSPFAVIWEPKKIESLSVSIVYPIYLPWSDGTRCHDLSFLNIDFSANFFTLLFHFHQKAL